MAINYFRFSDMYQEGDTLPEGGKDLLYSSFHGTLYLIKKLCILHVFSPLDHVRGRLTHCYRHWDWLGDVLANNALGQLEEAWRLWLHLQLQNDWET